MSNINRNIQGITIDNFESEAPHLVRKIDSAIEQLIKKIKGLNSETGHFGNILSLLFGSNTQGKSLAYKNRIAALAILRDQLNNDARNTTAECILDIKKHLMKTSMNEVCSHNTSCETSTNYYMTKITYLNPMGNDKTTGYDTDDECSTVWEEALAGFNVNAPFAQVYQSPST